jgi:hypothetical protein
MQSPWGASWHKILDNLPTVTDQEFKWTIVLSGDALDGLRDEKAGDPVTDIFVSMTLAGLKPAWR